MAQRFRLPDLGEGLHEAEIRDVLVSVGDEVEEGDEILTVETDKATVEIPSPFTGVIEEVMVEPGELVAVGDAVMTISGEEAEVQEEAEEEGEAAEEDEVAAETEEEAAASEKKAEDERPEAERPEDRPERAREGEGPIPASPATRRLARELAVDLSEVPASGPGGRVTSEDVRAYAEQTPEERERAPERERPPEEAPEAERAPMRRPAEAPELPDFGRWGPVERAPLRSVRRTTAKRMALAWSQIPHVSHRDMADVTELDRLRREQKDEIEAQSLTLTVFVMKALVAALKEHPRFNASLDMPAEEIILKNYYHLGMAVDTERGLIVPVVRDVDKKSITELSSELQELVARTQSEELSVDELQGGTFTITNVGMLGGVDFTPIINFPQVAILGMAQARWQPVVRGDEQGDMQIVPRYMLPLIVTFDHRVVDGADAARFMTMIVEILEDPDKLMLKM